MKSFFFAIFLSLSLTGPAEAADLRAKIDEIKAKLRPYVEEYLGAETADKLFGVKEELVALPKIPKIKKDAKSTEVYDRKEKTVDISEDKQNNYNYAFLEEIFTVTRNSKANESDISKWMNVMSQGGTREGVYRALVLDGTYAGLENYEQGINDHISKFAIYFLEKFVNETIKPQSLQQINFYTLKRIVTEKALEIIDEYYNKQEDLYAWYAVLSGELVERYPQIWRNKVRRIKSQITHREWAKSAPTQHIKSEVIIKLHKVFNHLLKVQ